VTLESSSKPLNNPTSRTASIVALNAVSTLAQISQFGLATTLLPIALEAKKASPDFIGITSSTFWLGMLFGLLIAGKLTRQFGYRNTVLMGLIISALSFVLMPLIDWKFWALPAAAIGFGLGLRWIANETWLYRLAPVHARGRVVGIHETLIGLASIIGPLIIVALGTAKPSAFWVGAVILVLAIAPLFVAEALPATDKASVDESSVNKLNLNIRSSLIFWLSFGGLIAGLGGWMEGGLVALLPVYAADIGLPSTAAAWLFTLFGIGAMLCQFPVGWLADQKGVLWTAKLCALIGAIAVVVAFAASLVALAIAVFLLGGITAGLLTLGMIWAAQHGTGAALTSKVRQVSIVYTTLSAAGPFVAGFVVNHTSSQSLFWQQLVVIFILGFILLKQSNSKI
jgi:MFS family permease